ncbi:MAG: hypothetical protein ACPG6A_03300, partial [Flavobacteriaceae bacterium]
MKKFYLIFALFFGLTFNLSAQETVIAVWDFNDNSPIGEIHPDYADVVNQQLGWLTNDQTDETGEGHDNEVTVTSRNGFSGDFLQGLNIDPSTDLVDGKIHFSIALNRITFVNTTDKFQVYLKTDTGGGSGTATHRLAGFELSGINASNGVDQNIKVSKRIYNGGNQYGTSKQVGHLGNANAWNYTTEINLGITVDYPNQTISFWVDSPGTYTAGTYGLGWANESNQSTTLTALVNQLVSDMQFNTVMMDSGSSVEVDQVKISTGTYENTVEAGDAAAPATPALALQGILDMSISSNGGKAVHLRANEDIADLSVYSLKNYNNGGTSAGGTYVLSGSATAGDDILVANDPAALNSYMSASSIFDTVLDTGNSFPYINGDDAVELNLNDSSIEVFGEIGVDGTGQAWEYLDTWAYKVDGAWTYGAVNCTDGSSTTWETDCVYPLAVGQQPVAYNVTFNVDMSNETVGATGVFLGGGFVGGANEYQMLDEDGDGIYSVTLSLNEGTSGNYIFLNGPTSASDWGTKEQLAGQSCADGQYDDRLLASVTEDTSVLFCFGTCEATCPADPCADVVGAPAIADDFDGNATDILEYFDDALTTTVVDGASLGASGNVLQYVDDGSGYYANVQVRTCNKFDMALTNYFTLDVYLDSSTITGTSPNQVQFKLQNGDLGAPWETQVV